MEKLKEGTSSVNLSPSSGNHSNIHSPLEKLESALAAWFKPACENNAFLDGAHVKKALHIAAHLGLTNLSASNGWIAGFKRRHNIVYRTFIR
jgi:hypothetical protein